MDNRKRQLSRLGYALRLIIAAGLVVAAVYGSTLALPWMAQTLAPLGYNAGTAQNLIIVAALLLAFAVILFATMNRLSTIGASPLLAPVTLIPVLALLLLDGPLFIRPAIDIPPLGEYVVLAFAGLFAILAGFCLVADGRKRQS